MLAAVFLTALVFGVALDFYLDLEHARTAALARARDARQAAILLERLARDLEASYLVVKPPERDPLEHPWIFLAEGGDPGSGADRIKFVSRGRRPRAASSHDSDLEVVVWEAVPAADDTVRLVRWSSPDLPPGLDRSFPAPGDEGAVVVAEGLVRFALRFLDDTGKWRSSWDSSTLALSSQLPRETEIELAFAPAPELGSEPIVHRRRVVLPLRPIDLEALLHPEAAGGTERTSEGEETGDSSSTGECATLARCLAEQPALRARVEELGIPAAVLDSIGERCFAETAPLLGLAPEACP